MRQGTGDAVRDMIQNDMAPTWETSSVRYAARLISLSMHIPHTTSKWMHDFILDKGMFMDSYIEIVTSA